MRQLIISNVAQIVMKKHNRKRKGIFVNTIKGSEIVSSAMVHLFASTKGDEGLVGYVKGLLLRHQSNQNDHHLNDSLTMLKTGFVQW